MSSGSHKRRGRDNDRRGSPRREDGHHIYTGHDRSTRHGLNNRSEHRGRGDRDHTVDPGREQRKRAPRRSRSPSQRSSKQARGSKAPLQHHRNIKGVNPITIADANAAYPCTGLDGLHRAGTSCSGTCTAMSQVATKLLTHQQNKLQDISTGMQHAMYVFLRTVSAERGPAFFDIQNRQQAPESVRKLLHDYKTAAKYSDTNWAFKKATRVLEKANQKSSGDRIKELTKLQEETEKKVVSLTSTLRTMKTTASTLRTDLTSCQTAYQQIKTQRINEKQKVEFLTQEVQTMQEQNVKSITQIAKLKGTETALTEQLEKNREELSTVRSAQGNRNPPLAAQPEITRVQQTPTQSEADRVPVTVADNLKIAEIEVCRLPVLRIHPEIAVHKIREVTSGSVHPCDYCELVSDQTASQICHHYNIDVKNQSATQLPCNGMLLVTSKGTAEPPVSYPTTAGDVWLTCSYGCKTCSFKDTAHRFRYDHLKQVRWYVEDGSVPNTGIPKDASLNLTLLVQHIRHLAKIEKIDKGRWREGFKPSFHCGRSKCAHTDKRSIMSLPVLLASHRISHRESVELHGSHHVTAYLTHIWIMPKATVPRAVNGRKNRFISIYSTHTDWKWCLYGTLIPLEKPFKLDTDVNDIFNRAGWLQQLCHKPSPLHTDLVIALRHQNINPTVPHDPDADQHHDPILGISAYTKALSLALESSSGTYDFSDTTSSIGATGLGHSQA
jgi:hypothetical protein